MPLLIVLIIETFFPKATKKEKSTRAALRHMTKLLGEKSFSW